MLTRISAAGEEPLFTAPKNHDGFEWRSVTKKDASGKMVPVSQMTAKTDFGYENMVGYTMSERPGLFRAFAEVDPTLDGCLAFANEHGGLGVAGIIEWDQQIEIRVPYFGYAEVAAGLDAMQVVPAERIKWQADGNDFAAWRFLVNLMKALVFAWDAVDQDKADVLGRWVKADDDIFIVTIPNLHKNLSPKVVGAVGIDGIPLSSREAVCSAICNVLTRVMRQFVRCNLYYNSHAGRAALDLWPHTLWGGMCLQFAQVIAGEKQIRQCPQCRKWFEVGVKGGRVDRVTCSDACRVALLRSRKVRAADLHAQGKSPGEIAHELDTETNTVKRWLKAQKEE